jgi:hypothetical protein
LDRPTIVGREDWTMRLLVTTVGAATVLAATLAAGAPGGTSAQFTICGQVKHGPRADWQLNASVARALGVSQHVAGTTWTVLAEGAPCTVAMKDTPALLRLWAKAPGKARLAPGPKGWICGRIGGTAAGKGSPGGACTKGSTDFAFIESGPYSITQIKRLAATGSLPLR